jgi:hydrogenase/urease accessory protein HupE
MAQGIYGVVIGLICLVAIPYDLPLTAVALVPAILALGFGGMHIRDAILQRRAESGTDQSSHSLR